MPVTPRSGTSPIPQTQIGTGMISPANAFVMPTGELTGLSFRFLFEIWQAVNQQAATNASLVTSDTNLQTAIAAINQRLTNAGIP